MNTRRIFGGAAAAAALSVFSLPAHAQFADPLASKPKPNMVVAFDTSVTMGISSNCSGCHRDSPWITTRLMDAKVQISNTLPLFKDLFVFGGVRYEGCGSAHVAQWVIPNMGNLPGSFANVMGMINGASECGSSERSLPGGSAGNCITATNLCTGDPPILQGLADGTLTVPGLTLPVPPVASSTLCGTVARLNQTPNMVNYLGTQLIGVSWPRFGAGVTAADVDAQVCTPLENALTATRNELASCLLGPTAYWNLQGFLAGGRASWCDAATIASNICAGASPFVNTCVCDDTNFLCQIAAGIPMSECGTPLDWKARQQVGICATYATSWGGSPATLGSFFDSQPDNVRLGGCRENVAVFFTDGAYGSTGGVAAEGAGALIPTYSSATAGGASNMFTFHISNYFGGEAAVMAAALGNPLYSAQDGNSMLDSFSRIVNRVYHGDYSAANMTVDRFGTRVVFHRFKVPKGLGAGANDTGERYLGRPSKLSMYALDAAGAVTGAPIFETDWATRVSAPLNGPVWGYLCSPNLPSGASPQTGPGTSCNMTPAEEALFGNGVGLATTFRNGVNRNTPAFMVDGYSRKWGNMLGGSSTQPVIVDAPREVPQGTTLDLNWQSYLNDPLVKGRPRMIYVMSNGFLHGIHGGDRVDGAPTIAIAGLNTKLRYNYNDNPATTQAGKEMFRFFVRTYDTTSDFALNDVVPRPVTTGQIVVKEMHLSNAGAPTQRFGTVLALAQGKDGRGFATLNVTDPAHPTLMAEWIPAGGGTTASNEPMMYQFPAVAGAPTPVVVVTDGLNGTRSSLFAYDVRNGNLVTSIALPGGMYPTEPVCLDATGAGTITQCYVLSSTGNLVRVDVTAGAAFVNAVTVNSDAVGGGRVFLTRPIGFFGPDGAINLAFGSGLSTDLTSPDSGSNGLFKVIDNTNRTSAGSVTSANACSIGNVPGPGFINIGSERIIAPPVISKGVVAFTTYSAAVGNSCGSGTAKLYAMDYAKCTDAFDPTRTNPPAPVAIPPGIPASPVILRGKAAVLTQASDGTSALPSSQSNANAQTRGGMTTPFRALYWRPAVNAH